MMSVLFNYRWTGKSQTTVEVIFKPPASSSAADLATSLNQAAQEPLYPDGILVICLESDRTATEAMLAGNKVGASLHRFNGKTSLHLVVVDITCQPRDLICVQHIAATRDLCNLDSLTKAFPSIIRTGAEAVFARRGVVVRAPPGFEFVKPSGDRSSHFLRAEEALFTSATVDFLALALLSRLRIDDLKVIFVDSMAIAAIAYSLREMRLRAGKQAPQIISFHSHQGLDELSIPAHRTFFCIISASSSMSLHRKWVFETRCADDDVVTLLTFNDARDARRALCAVARPEGWKHRATSTAGMRQLRIYGERFQPEQIPPKKVPLALVAHKCEKAARLAGDYCNQSLLSVNGLDSSGHRRTLLVDGQVLVDSPPFDDWLIKQLRSRVPASIQGIVFQDDPSSKQMAEKCAAYLKELAIDLPWGLHSSVDLDGGLTTLIAERALLIVAAVVSKGSQLLGISRDLRTSHFGSKSYLIGVQMCDTESEASFLKRNLSQTKDGTNNFECFHVLATGGALKESLREEESAIRGSDARAGALAYRWDARRQKGLVEDTFLPALVTQNHRLKLRPDFVFWSCDYVESARHAPTVLATIGAILQRARTEDFRLDEHRLASDAFQQVVLDPQNFNRYNDGIIQASILRQAYSSELDYSTLPDESRFMLVLIKKLLVARNKQQGEAVAEFAFAIGSGRLKLQEDDHVALITWANAFLSDQSGDFELKCLLDPTYGGAAHGAVI